MRGIAQRGGDARGTAVAGTTLLLAVITVWAAARDAALEIATITDQVTFDASPSRSSMAGR